MATKSLVASSPSLDYRQFFRNMPGRFIVFAADDPVFTIIEENEAHARMWMVERDKVIGRPVLEVFPDTSQKYIETGVSDLLESFRKVIRSGKPDTMETLRYDLKSPQGEFEERYFRVTHYPLFDAAGKVEALYQETDDITQDVARDRQLAQTRRQLDEALSVGLVGTWIWDLKQDAIIADKSLAAMFGVDADQAARGLPLEVFTDRIHQEDTPRVMASVAAAISQKGSFECEYRTVLGGGSMRWVIARGRVETDETGQPALFPGVIVDITDRKRFEDALQRSETEMKFMADSMPQLVWVARPDGYHEYYNRQWYDYTGAAPGAELAHGWLEGFHPDDRERARKAWRHALKTGAPYEIEYRLRNGQTGEYRWFMGRALPLRDADGNIVKWYGTSTDIDDRKRAAIIQEFLSSVSRALAFTIDYKKTLAKVADLIVPEIADWCSIDMLDSKGEFMQVALVHKDPARAKWAKQLRKKYPPRMEDSAGVPEVIRTGKSEFWPEISEEQLAQIAQNEEHLKMLKGVGLVSEIIVPITVNKRTVGAITLVSAEQKKHFTSIDREMAEELAHRASMAISKASLYQEAQEELKERRRLQRELRLANEKLEARVQKRTAQLETSNLSLTRSNQELQDFAYVASHDLQEPLRKIQAFGNLLQDEFGEQLGEGSDYLDRMRNAASRMSVLIEDLLAFSRVTTQARPFEPVDLMHITKDVLSDLEALIAENNATIHLAELPTVMADPMQMRQLMQNLISNAIKFHKPDVPSEVSLSAKTSKKKGGKIAMHTIYVADNGIGFEEKYLDRIFAVFQRLHTRETYKGTGIGLAVCRKIVERHGGEITAKSKVGSGSTFIIKLPANVKGER